jgi:cell division protein FtsW
VVLVVFGLIVLSSAGVIEGQKRFNDPYYYVKHQLLYGLLPGVVLMLVLAKIDFRFWRKTSLLILFSALTLMILVFIPQFAVPLKGAKSWISLFGYTFQPAELLKLALVIYLAAWFGIKEERVRNWTYGTLPFIFVVGFVAGLLVLQPDLGTLVVVLAISAGVYFMAGARLKHIGIIAILSLAIIAGLIVVAPYRINRIKSFLNPAIDPRGISYQLNQSLIAIGSGGLTGVGFGQSKQKLGFLPETIGDSIFAIVAEELGLIGAGGLIGIFILLCIFLVETARRTTDRFGRLYVMGIAIWITGQAFINIAAVTGVGPLTGIPLPFISYGGTSLAALMASMGIVLNIAKR